ncbi:MAG TPA: VWA domain-containing protein [Gaiella sp.]|nr:VWA domain-containing protein [Gaiella sp.]
MLASLVLLTPLGALAVAGVAVVVLAFFVAGRKVGAVRSALRLEAPRHGDRMVLAALVAVVVLAALVAVQPAWEARSERQVRSDAQVDVVIDTSRSMLASAGATGETRLVRAKQAAVAIRAGVPDVEVGVGTLTDRVLPNLLPSASEESFDATVRESIEIEQPPPASVGVTATTLAALAQVSSSGTFSPTTRKRVLVVLTDGESRPFDPGSVAAALRRNPGTALVLVHVWGADESIYGADGAPEAAYHPDPASRAMLASLADAAGGSVFGERQTGRVVDAVRRALGSGPTATAGLELRTRPLGRYVALVALVPLALVLRRRNLR